MYIIIISRSSPIIPLCVHARPRIFKKKNAISEFVLLKIKNSIFFFFFPFVYFINEVSVLVHTHTNFI